MLAPPPPSPPAVIYIGKGDEAALKTCTDAGIKVWGLGVRHWACWACPTGPCRPTAIECAVPGCCPTLYQLTSARGGKHVAPCSAAAACLCPSSPACPFSRPLPAQVVSFADFFESGKGAPLTPVPPKPDDICCIMYTRQGLLPTSCPSSARRAQWERTQLL